MPSQPTPVNKDYVYSNEVSREDIRRAVVVNANSYTPNQGYPYSSQVSHEDILRVVPVDINTGGPLAFS